MPNEYSGLTAEATPAESTPAERDEEGRFLLGNEARRTHGVKAFETRGEVTLPQELRDELAAFRAGVEADQGGVDELTTIGVGYVRRLAEIEAICQLLGADLRVRGLFTKRGRMRATYKAFLLALDRWDRFAQRLGLDRRAKRVPSLAEIMAKPTEPHE